MPLKSEDAKYIEQKEKEVKELVKSFLVFHAEQGETNPKNYMYFAADEIVNFADKQLHSIFNGEKYLTPDSCELQDLVIAALTDIIADQSGENTSDVPAGRFLIKKKRWKDVTFYYAERIVLSKAVE